jgi:hypothetical protein
LRLDVLRRYLEIALPVIETNQFVRCEVCGQFYDMRDFVEVWYHDDEPHLPMKADA